MRGCPEGDLGAKQEVVLPLAVAAIVAADVGFEAEPAFPVPFNDLPQPLASALVIELPFDRKYE